MTSNSYSFVEKPTSDFYSVKLNEGQFRGAVVTYGAVSLREENGQATLKFTFKVEESPKPYSIEELNGSLEFKNFLGDVLSHILDESFATGKFKLGNAQSPNNDTPKAGN